MPSQGQTLGIMKPLGGGDPIPLRKAEMVVGRRPSCDIRLDFENVSGKHCMLRFQNQVWHVRDLGSTNGTTVNGSAVASEHAVMPDDELRIASHIFSIDYEPGAPEAIMSQHHLADGDEELSETRKRTSLVQLAGLDTDDDRPKRQRPSKAPETIERLSVDEAEFEDALPEHVKADPKPVIEANDDDFLKLIEDDVINPDKG